jgi:hypothetical protein
VVEVVGEPNADTALRRADERRAHDVRRAVAEAEAVEREVEARARAVEEGAERLRDVERGLTAVGQEAKLQGIRG